MVDVAPAPPLITTSRLRTFRRCAEEHHLTYELGYRPIASSDALAIGTLVHSCLEAWFLKLREFQSAARELNDVAQDAIVSAAIEKLMELGAELDPYDHIKVQEMLLAYHVRWIAEPLRVLAVELQFEGELLNPDTGAASRTWRRGGKLDVVAEHPDLGRVIIEHKTSSQDIGPGSVYMQRLAMDPQVSDYFEGARLAGFDVQACIYDVLKKCSLRPYSATPPESRKYTKDGRLYANQREADETTADFRIRVGAWYAQNLPTAFQRAHVVRLRDELHRAQREFWETARLIREASLQERHPRNPDACERYGELCSFFGVCTRTASLDDPTKFRKATTTNEELRT